MATAWPRVKLGDHIDFLSGFAFKSKEYSDDGCDIRLLRGDNCGQGYIRWEKAKRWRSEEYAEFERYQLKLGDIILAMDRPWISAGLKYAWVTEADLPSLLVQRVARMRGMNGLETGYLKALIGNSDFTNYVIGITTGVNVPHISGPDIRAYKFSLPPLPIQRRIAGILSAYDDLIEVNTRRIKALEEMARRTYEDWLEDYGEVPKAKLTEIAELTMGQSPKSEFYNEDGEGMPFHQGVTNFGTLYPKHKLFSTAGNREAEEGDILFSVRAPVGRINIAPSKMILGRGLAAIRSKNEAQAFLLSALKHEFSEEDKIGNGAIFKAVTKADMQNIELPNPQDDELQKVEGIFKSYWEQIGNLVKQNKNLRAQRDLLLPRLVSGEIDVSDAEQTLEAAE